MDAEERWFWVWLSIFTILLGTSPFAYWQGYHVSGVFCGVAGLGGLFMLIRDRLATTASKLPITVSLKVLAVLTLSMSVGQLIEYEIIGRHANVQPPSIQWWLYGLALLFIVVVASAVLSKRKPSKLKIHWANYRAVDGGGAEYPVGEFLGQIISGDSLVFDIENDNFKIGGKNFVPRDPLFGKQKRLQVNYSYGGSQPVTTERREHGRLLLPEDSKITWLMGEVDKINQLHLEENRIQLPLTALQVEAIRLSSELLDFLKRLGPAPAPKYTAADIDKMTSAETEALVRAQDGDFFDACSYHRGHWDYFVRNKQGLENEGEVRMTRMFKWHQKLEAAYVLEGLKGKMEGLRNRFIVAGVEADALIAPIPYKDSEQHIHSTAAKLWELAFKAGERG
jgi:hypothetical protein